MSLCGTLAAALLNPDTTVPPGLRARDGANPQQRWSIHRNNVMVSLIDALADSFPVTQTLVGEAFFRAAAREFVRQCPPHSPVLTHFGDRFADFLNGFPPAAELAYLPDVARLEWLRQCAIYAADALPMSATEIQTLAANPDRLMQHRWCLHPSVGLLMSPYPVVSIWAAHQEHDQDCIPQVLATIQWRPEAALVMRDDDSGTADVCLISTAQATLLEDLRTDRTLVAALETAQSRDPSLDLPSSLAMLWMRGVWADASSIDTEIA